MKTKAIQHIPKFSKNYFLLNKKVLFDEEAEDLVRLKGYPKSKFVFNYLDYGCERCSWNIDKVLNNKIVIPWSLYNELLLEGKRIQVTVEVID